MLAVIIRAGGVDLTSLTDALRDADIDEAIVISNLMGDSLIDPPAERPNFVVGILNPSEAGASGRVGDGTVSTSTASFTNLDVVLRIGMATERGVPSLLIVPPPLLPPSGSPSLVIVPCSLEDEDSLLLHVWAFTASVLEGRDPAAPQPLPIRRNDLRQWRFALPDTYGPEAGLATYNVVSHVFRAAGVELAENPFRGPDMGFDLALLSSRQSDDVVLVEVKAGPLSEERLRDAERQLRNAVMHRHASLGLLVYHDVSGKKFPQSATQPMVVRIALADLIDRLAVQDFSDILTSEVAEAMERM
jgi:hypothetical protein